MNDKFVELARKVRAMVRHHAFDHVYQREQRACGKCQVLSQFDATMAFMETVVVLPPVMYDDNMCHHQHPLKAPGVAMFSHPKSEPCPFQKVKRKRK